MVKLKMVNLSMVIFAVLNECKLFYKKLFTSQSKDDDIVKQYVQKTESSPLGETKNKYNVIKL